MENFSLWGAIVNSLAIVLGATVGMLLHTFALVQDKDGGVTTSKTRVNDLPRAMMIGVGLCTMLIGIQGAIKGQNTIVTILSVVFGALVGTLLDLDSKINRFGEFVEKKTKNKFGNVSQGFVSASLLFCVGAMAVTGPLESGLNGNHSTQYAKSILDCISSIVFASSMGVGVVLSAAVVLVYQGAITLLAQWLQPLLSESVVTEMTAVGSLLIIGIAFDLLGIVKIKLMNYIPAVFFPILFALFLIFLICE